MNKKICLLVCIIMFAGMMNGFSQIKDQQAIIKKIFEVIKNRDEQGFIKLFPKATSMRAYMQKIIDSDKNNNVSEAMKAYFATITDSTLQQELRTDFRKIIERGKGIDWPHADFISFRADTVMLDDEAIKTKSLKGRIYFNADGKDYFISFAEIIWFDDEGWYGVTVRRIDKKEKEWEADVSEWDDTFTAEDSAALAADTIAGIPTPPTPVQKPKAKEPVRKNPVKPASQTPARKS